MAAAAAYCKLACMPRTSKFRAAVLAASCDAVDAAGNALHLPLANCTKKRYPDQRRPPDLLARERAEVEELTYPGGVIFISVALNGLKVGEAVFVEVS